MFSRALPPSASRCAGRTADDPLSEPARHRHICDVPGLRPRGGLPALRNAADLSQRGEALVCHHCNRRYPVPTVCPECQGRRIRYFGAGTERVEEAVRQEFPDARTLRWDRDVTGAKGSHDAILSKFTAHEADVLIGTQMIAKGSTCRW